MRKRFRISAVLALVASTYCSAVAQVGFNCDLNAPFSTELGGGVPSSTFAAAGSAGYWNSVYTGGVPGQFLRGLDGQVTNVLLTGPSGGGGGGHNIPGLTGDFRALMADARSVGFPGDTYTLSGLQNGDYRVITYASKISGGSTNAFVTVHQATTPNPQLVTGVMPVNQFVLGVTHSLHEARVTNGTLSIYVEEAVPTAYINGFQIVAVPEPGSVACLCAGLLALLRKRKK